jgi:biotin carboxyl carrier protein
MLDDAGFDVPEINMNAYMEARKMTQEFIDDFLGYWINPKNRFLSSLMIQSGLPGGMMGSLMADLKGVQDGINFSLKAAGKPEMSEDDLLIKLFEEVEYIWPKMGYPPLVTPYSQYVKNVALMNIMQMAKGEERYSMIDDNTWNMLLGKAGNLPGPVAPEIIELAKQQKREFYEGLPQDAYPDDLETYRKEMKENGWETGQDDEELFEFAMHETQYRDYKSGIAKERFEQELEKMKSQESTPKTTVAVNEKQEPKRGSYSKDEVNEKIAMAAFLMYTLNTKTFDKRTNGGSHHDIWNRIGYWRNLNKVALTYEDKEYDVEFKKPDQGEYVFTIGKEVIAGSVEFIDKGEIDFKVDDKTFNAKIRRGEEMFTKVAINDQEFQMYRNDLLDTGLSAHAADEAVDESKNILSPIPGKIFKILVKEGEQVRKGDIVIVIDAMKMENNITTKRDAKIKKILVNLGEMVEVGAPLVELD